MFRGASVTQQGSISKMLRYPQTIIFKRKYPEFRDLVGVTSWAHNRKVTRSRWSKRVFLFPECTGTDLYWSTEEEEEE